jgi:hypothetical protein
MSSLIVVTRDGPKKLTKTHVSLKGGKKPAVAAADAGAGGAKVGSKDGAISRGHVWGSCWRYRVQVER